MHAARYGSKAQQASVLRLPLPRVRARAPHACAQGHLAASAGDVGARIILLKGHYPGLDLARVLAYQPRMLLQSCEELDRSARQVRARVRARVCVHLCMRARPAVSAGRAAQVRTCLRVHSGRQGDSMSKTGGVSWGGGVQSRSVCASTRAALPARAYLPGKSCNPGRPPCALAKMRPRAYRRRPPSCAFWAPTPWTRSWAP